MPPRPCSRIAQSPLTPVPPSLPFYPLPSLHCCHVAAMAFNPRHVGVAAHWTRARYRSGERDGRAGGGAGDAAEWHSRRQYHATGPKGRASAATLAQLKLESLSNVSGPLTGVREFKAAITPRCSRPAAHLSHSRAIRLCQWAHEERQQSCAGGGIRGQQSRCREPDPFIQEEGPERGMKSVADQVSDAEVGESE